MSVHNRSSAKDTKPLTTPRIALSDAYERSGRVYMTGMQALTRLLLSQADADRRAGLNTAGFVSGYRGSPLGGLDSELMRQKARLDAAAIRFQPGLNEELAATAVWGTQQIHAFGGAKYDGVFALWYGKGPGVDRSGDAFKHGVRNGAAQNGGVLLAFGDDHPGKSSTIAHQSDPSIAALGIPVLTPATLDDVIAFGRFGWAASRFSGIWVGLKCVNETAEATAAVEVQDAYGPYTMPGGPEAPPEGLHARFAFEPLADEGRHLNYRLPAFSAFAAANPVDTVTIAGARDGLGIVAPGKSWLDVLEALRLLGLTDPGGPVSLYKIGLSWPIDRQGFLAFAEGKRELLIVEEKAPLIEQQAASILYNAPAPSRPALVGKHDETGRPLVPVANVLHAGDLAVVIGERLERLGLAGPELRARIAEIKSKQESLADTIADPARKPWFCSGCPHNTSTKTPQGSVALTGIGCHTMAIWMDRRSLPPTQMGGEGANWIGMAPFVETDHVFQNLGDGTYNHSGILAIRAAVAAGANITFKLLFNDAVAMTGGQAHEGGLTVGDVVAQVQAENVARVAVVAADPGKVSGPPLPATVELAPRDRLDEIQRELRETPGVTVLVYDQTCAAELRRLRKRGRAATPPRRVLINERVCEGCGDCSTQSNCVSVAPKPTAFGVKRTIDQSSCNRDYSCVDGFCPSFVQVRGQLRTRRPHANEIDLDVPLPPPARASCDDVYNILVAGIGGTGVVTVGALVGMAAQIEGKRFAIYDMTGLAQKGGAVYSHVRVGAPETEVFGPRIPEGGADVLVACDLHPAVSGDGPGFLDATRTRAFAREESAPPGAFQLGVQPESESYPHKLAELLGGRAPAVAPAARICREHLGDSAYANVLLLGYTCQAGALPVGAEALERAIELNGVKTAENIAAFRLGRIAFAMPERLAPEGETDTQTEEADGPDEADDFEAIVAHRARELRAYQDAAYARRYRDRVERFARAAEPLGSDALPLLKAVAFHYYKLLAYKDEYEVARLYADGAFRRRLEEEFETIDRVELWLAPPLISRTDPKTGRPKKRRFGPWIFPLFSVLARLKVLRRTPFDPFGWTRERRMERRLIRQYEADLDLIEGALSAQTLGTCLALARLPDDIRGFGPVKEASIEEVAARRAGLRSEIAAGHRSTARAPDRLQEHDREDERAA